MKKVKSGADTAGRRADVRRRGDPGDAGFQFEDSPFYLIARINGRYTIEMERKLKAIGMDIPRWRALVIVQQRGPCSITDIANLAVVRLPTMTRVLQRLAQQGLVRMAPRASDGRHTDVALTEQGRSAVERVSVVASRIYRAAFGKFTAGEIEGLNDTLRRVFTELESPA
jgi:MarR family transcriptional regulator, organic hydroperoxide resistance regulator